MLNPDRFSVRYWLERLLPETGRGWRPRLRRLLLDFDARLDTTLFQSGRWLSEYYEEMRQIKLALRYAMLAKYRYKSHIRCGSDSAYEKKELLARIERL